MSMATGQPALKQPIAGRPLRDDVREYLRDAILHSDLEPGAQIVETRLAREFGISQGPVREALRELEQIGLVEHRAWRGVNPLSWTLFTLTVLRERDLIEIAERHRPILEALRSRDTALVEQAISDHILQLGSEVGHGLPG